MVATEAAPKRETRTMHTQDHITYSIDQTRLRIGAAIGVLVITAGFALGVLIHTGSSASSSACPRTLRASPTITRACS